MTEQAANGTYGSQSLKAIQSEVSARLFEINRLAANAEFNGIKLMAFNKDGNNNDGVGITPNGVNLQVGLYADANSTINLSTDLFANASLNGLFKGMGTKEYPTIDTDDDGNPDTETFENLLAAANGDIDTLDTAAGIEAFAAACCGLKYIAGADADDPAKYYLQDKAQFGAKEMLVFLDASIDDISSRITKIGAAQNRVQSAITALDVQSQNLTSSLSTLRDTDVAEESSTYIQQQILQQSSATLLSTANQLPSIALNLI